jgi:hypothetical protein
MNNIGGPTEMQVKCQNDGNVQDKAEAVKQTESEWTPK